MGPLRPMKFTRISGWLPAGHSIPATWLEGKLKSAFAPRRTTSFAGFENRPMGWRPSSSCPSRRTAWKNSKPCGFSRSARSISDWGVPAPSTAGSSGPLSVATSFSVSFLWLVFTHNWLKLLSVVYKPRKFSSTAAKR